MLNLNEASFSKKIHEYYVNRISQFITYTCSFNHSESLPPQFIDLLNHTQQN